MNNNKEKNMEFIVDNNLQVKNLEEIKQKVNKKNNIDNGKEKEK